MKYEIISELTGRMRIRYGRYAFESQYEYAIKKYFEEESAVVEAQVSYLTGSVLLLYDEEKKKLIKHRADDLNLNDLIPGLPDSYKGNRIIDNQFLFKIIRIVSGQVLRGIFFPMILKNAFTIYQSIKYLSSGLKALRKGKINVDVLDAAAIGASIGQGNIGTASSIMFLLKISEQLESYTMEKTKNLLTNSLIERIDSIWIEKNGRRKQIKISELKKGDIAVINLGMTFPIDGKITVGEAIVNQSAMTGEPLGVHKKPGDSVFAGTVIEEGNLLVEVRELPDNTRINQIVNMISESEKLKAGIQSNAENIADKIVPFSFLLSAGILLLTRDVSKALSALMVDYSCAIKLATPISVISAMKEASECGIVVKGGKYFEALAEADTIVFDKTGTLTKARPKVEKVIPLENYSREEILKTAACIEEHFPHSMAQAIVSKAKEENLRHEEEHTEVEYIVAHGIATTINGKKVHIGSRHFIFEDEQVPLSKKYEKLIKDESQGASVIYLAIDGRLAGFICITDPVRSESEKVIKDLRLEGFDNIIILTGDSDGAAKKIATELGIDSYKANVLPGDKAEIIKELKSKGHKVIMVGDGINDSPALSEADVSVSMQDASDLARQVANITLIESDLRLLVKILKISKLLMKRIHNNFRFIASFNSGLLILGTTETLTQLTTAFLHNASTVGISAASMRKYLKEDK